MKNYGGMTKEQYEKFIDDYERGYPELVGMLRRTVRKVNEITGLDWSRVIAWEKLESGK
jgi:hypothetical protein